MTQEQVAKAKELSKNIESMTNCIGYLNTERHPYCIVGYTFFEEAVRIAKDEVLPIFEKKLQELKNELASL